MGLVGTTYVGWWGLVRAGLAGLVRAELGCTVLGSVILAPAVKIVEHSIGSIHFLKMSVIQRSSFSYVSYSIF